MTHLFDSFFPADLARVGDLRSALRACLEGLGVAEIHMERLILVVDEVVSNAIEHGGHYRGGAQPIRVQVWREADGLRVAVDDLDTPAEVREALAAELGQGSGTAPDALNERGRGLFLIHTFLAELAVSAVDGAGMRLQGRLVESLE